ncbi:hypothetical protein X801_10297 [Opisthorchis viverrini]|uniref:Negative elongation factor E n=1 Tax=Opisthorchis viverrini TaxID=6198 RepID=A0A1S8WHJ5_OPIVI|nr:hypothetical protein X801_10297 [Opisthorchis viverrini]
MPRDYTEPEKALKKELATLRKMKRTLTEISQIKREEKPRAAGKTGEKAKEEAMELLRSGAIQIADKKERHTFKRRPKDPEEEEPGRTPTKSAPRDKQLLYGNFLRGPKLMPANTEAKEDRSEEFSSKPPLISSDLDCSVSNPQYNTESLATKRKQQLLTLSEDEDEATGNHTSSVTDAPADPGHSGESPKSSDTTLYVGYHKVTEGFIQKLLQPVGHIVRIKISEHQNHAYVTMATHEMAQKAIELDHQMVDNRLLRVGFARRQCSRPRRDPRPLGPFSPKSGFGKSPSKSKPQIDELVDGHRRTDPAFSLKRFPFPDSDSQTLTTSSDRSSLYLCVRPSDQTVVEVQKDNAYPLTPERPFNACRRPTVTQVASPGHVYALRRQSDLCFGWCHTRKTPLYRLDNAACRRNCPPASYNSVPPTEVSRDLVTYEDLDYGDQ